MARISGIDLPRDKRIEIALTYVFGIGRKTATDICANTGVNPDIRVRDLSEDDAAKLREYIDEINSHYPPDVVNYYSPNYAEGLIKRLEEYHAE